MFLVDGEQDFTCLFNFTSTIFFLKYMTCHAHTYVMHNRDTLNENIWQCPVKEIRSAVRGAQQMMEHT